MVLASNTDLDAVMQMAENAKESGKCVYAVGRNSDMRQMAGKAALTSVVVCGRFIIQSCLMQS